MGQGFGAAVGERDGCLFLIVAVVVFAVGIAIGAALA